MHRAVPTSAWRWQHDRDGLARDNWRHSTDQVFHSQLAPLLFFSFRTVSHLCLFLPPLRPGPHSCYGLGLGCDSGKLLPAGAFVKATPPSACCTTCCYWRCVCGHRRSPRNQPARGSCLRPSCCSGSQAAVGQARPHPTCSPRGPAPRRAAVAVARWR